MNDKTIGILIGGLVVGFFTILVVLANGYIIMDDKTVGILIGSLMGGLFTLLGALANGSINRRNLFAQLHHQQSKEERNRRLDKLENLHELVTEYINSTHTFVTGVLELRHFNKVNEGLAEVSNRLLHPFSKIDSKLKIYAPELEPKWTNLGKNVRQILTVAEEYFTQPSRSDSELHNLHDKLNKNCHILLRDIEPVCNYFRQSAARLAGSRKSESSFHLF
jgi:hypothetical protein